MEVGFFQSPPTNVPDTQELVISGAMIYMEKCPGPAIVTLSLEEDTESFSEL